MVDEHFPSTHFVVVQPIFEQMVVVALPLRTFAGAWEGPAAGDVGTEAESVVVEV